jgi:3-oxoacyl-(acyl-carrier-protein) synthase
VMGEGAYTVIVEDADQHARRGGAEPRGEILGFAAGSEAVPINAWPAHPESIACVMRAALADAGVEPGGVGVLYAAANSTRGLDCVEAQAIAEVFAGSSSLVVTSIKGTLGEAASSSAASVVAALMCGAHGQVPPVAGLTHVDACAVGLRLVTKEPSTTGDVVMVNGISSGGAICSMVLRVHRGTHE